MRILHVAEVSHGGVITLVRSFAEAQVDAGHDVHLMLQPDVEAPVGRVHRWSPHRRRPLELAHAVSQLRRTIDDVMPAIVHLHSFFPGLLGRLSYLPDRVAVVYQPHSWAFQALPSGLARQAVVRWERHAARRTTTVITNCADEWAEARGHGVEAAAAVVGLPLDTDRFHPVAPERRAFIRRELGLPTSGDVLVCVGRLSAQKGQDSLVAAWERRPLTGSTLVLVGPGDPAYLADMAPRSFGRSILHVGPQDDVRPWLWAADLAVQPSLYEGQSVAMAEAMACGRPLVMTDVNGAREAIVPAGQDSAGAIVPVGDMGAFLDACASRLGDERERLESEGRTARRRAVELFDQDAVIRRVEAVYQSALAAVQREPSTTTEGALQ